MRSFINISADNPFYKTEKYQFASGLTPCGRIGTDSKRFQLLYWLLKASKNKRK